MNQKSERAGLSFEKAIEEVFRIMYQNYPNSVIEHNVDLDGHDGKRQFDVVIKVKLPDDELIIVIEGKDYNRKLSIEKIDAFHSKMVDVNASKGILISKKGFSTKAISKAKRVGIILYSLMSPVEFRETDLELHVLVKEISPIHLNISYKAEMEELKKLPPKLYFGADDFIVNKLNVRNVIIESWKKNSFSFLETENEQKISLLEFADDCDMQFYYDQNTQAHGTFKVKNVEFFITLRFKYYIIDLKDYLHTPILENVHKKHLKFFVDQLSIVNSIKSLSPVTREYAYSFTGIKAIIRVKGKMEITFNSMEARPDYS